MKSGLHLHAPGPTQCAHDLSLILSPIKSLARTLIISYRPNNMLSLSLSLIPSLDEAINERTTQQIVMIKKYETSTRH